MPDYLNINTKPDEGTKHVQRKIINRKTKELKCVIRLKPSGLSMRLSNYGRWYTVQLEDLISWLTDSKNRRKKITKS
jgi:hypothetical protein